MKNVFCFTISNFVPEEYMMAEQQMFSVGNIQIPMQPPVMAAHTKLKLIVEDSQNSRDIMKFIRANKQQFKQMNVAFEVIAISSKDKTPKTINSLRRKGIHSLPALIVPKGKVRVGYKEIRNVLDKNINELRTMGSVGPHLPPGSDRGSSTNPNAPISNIHDYWAREMSWDKLNEQEADRDEDTDDLDRKMREYKPPAHRMPQQGPDHSGMSQRGRPRTTVPQMPTPPNFPGGAGGMRRGGPQSPEERWMEEGQYQDNIPTGPMNYGAQMGAVGGRRQQPARGGSSSGYIDYRSLQQTGNYDAVIESAMLDKGGGD